MKAEFAFFDNLELEPGDCVNFDLQLRIRNNRNYSVYYDYEFLRDYLQQCLNLFFDKYSNEIKGNN